MSEIQNQAVLNANETGWRMQGKTYWLWCLATKNAAYYLIDPKHGGSVLETVVPFIFQRFVGDQFLGAYNSVSCLTNQKCIPHLLWDLNRTRHYHNPGGDWPEFH